MSYFHFIHRLGLLVLSAALGACSSFYQTAPESPPQAEQRLYLLQVNDSYKIEGLENGRKGGFARLRTLRRQLEASGTPVLLMHGGDLLFPSVMSRYLQADAMIEILNRLDGEPDAFDERMLAVFGNHEFDSNDPGLLLRRVAQADFGWVSSNTAFAFSESAPKQALSKRLNNVHQRIVKTIGGIRVGVFGLTLDSRQPPYIEIMYSTAERQRIVSQALAELQAQGAQLIVALTHQDLEQDQWLAEQFPAIDLIIGGHEHFFIERQQGRTWITKADADNQSAILHEIRLGDDGQISTSHQKIVLDERIAKDSAVDAAVSQQIARLHDYLRQQGRDPEHVFGYTRHWLEGVEPVVRSRETALGDVLADVIRESMNADVALLNAGSIRINDNIPPGPITAYDLEGIFYYDSSLVSFELSGAQLLELLQQSVSRAHLGDGGFLQVSGLRFNYHVQMNDGQYRYTINPQEVEILQRRDKGFKPLQLQHRYRVGSSHFIWSQGASDGYPIFSPATRPPRIDRGSAVQLRAAFEKKLKRLPHNTLQQDIEGRIKRIEDWRAY